jgi:Uma2 family endonuclease
MMRTEVFLVVLCSLLQTLPDLLPGWELTVSELWPPVFE